MAVSWAELEEDGREWEFNPGHLEARKRGCLCPHVDNNWGESPPLGRYGWILVVGCPMHPTPKEE